MRPSNSQRTKLIFLVSFLCLSLFPAVYIHANGTSFFDNLIVFNTSHWNKADGWTNGSPFDVGWRADHISHSNGIMTLTLDDQPCPGGCSGKPYASGEYRTSGPDADAFYGYGCFEARFKPASGSGLITSFFSYNGEGDDIPPDGNGLHNEIDIEILGIDTIKLHTNFHSNLVSGEPSGNEQVVNLGFDAAADYHNYGFKWTADGIDWFVDGNLVVSAPNLPENPTPDAIPANGGPQKIMMNLWAVNENGEEWAGPFFYTGPVTAHYDWIKYTVGSDCTMTATGPEAPEVAITSGDDYIELSWPHMLPNAAYDIHHETQPYFDNSPATLLHSLTQPFDDVVTYVDTAAGIGDVTNNHFYYVVARNSINDEAMSNQVGEFDFAILSGN